MSNRAALGAAGVPSGAFKVEEAEVRLLLPERVRVDAKREGGVGMAELRSNPSDALPRRQRKAREDVFPVSRSRTFGWSKLRDTLRGLRPQGASRYGWKEEAIPIGGTPPWATSRRMHSSAIARAGRSGAPDLPETPLLSPMLSDA
jgi:hypothetical protein